MTTLSREKRSEGCVSLLPSKPHPSEWLDRAQSQNSSCKAGGLGNIVLISQPLQYGGHSRRRWSKCQTSIRYVCYNFKQTTVLKICFFAKGSFTNSTQEKMVSSEPKLNVHSEMDRFMKQDCPNKNEWVLKSTHKEGRDGNSFISSILPIEESTKVSTLCLCM